MRKKKWFVGLLLYLFVFSEGLCMAAPIPLRGVVEGFYGTPWSDAARIDFFAFAKEEGFNAYIYAPKDDPYHRIKWREPYPEEELRRLRALVQAAQAQEVRFIFAVSPGLDIALSGVGRYSDRQKLLDKMEALYAQGVRDFAVFFDDIQEKDGEGQAALLNWLLGRLRAQHTDIGLLITVPTEYALPDMRSEGGTASAYTRALSTQLEKDVLVLYTGDGVVQGSLSDTSYHAANRLYRRSLGIWWNYPANDYMEEKLALGPIENLPENSEIPAIFFNPMKEEVLSKIALATGAAYAKAPAQYDADQAWADALKTQYGKLAGDMAQFAAHSTHLENSWACIGRSDGKAFSEKAARVLAKDSTDVDFAQMDKEIRSLRGAVSSLLKKLPDRTRAKCLPQLQQLQRVANASYTALGVLRAERAGDTLRTRTLRYGLSQQLEEIKRQEKDARISEDAGIAFIEAVMKRP